MSNWQPRLAHRFVETIPETLEPGELYISLTYRTAVHLCACGCGNEVVTPLSPVRWQLTFDGESVSLDPSIGNWSLPCRSHYWIRHGRVQRAAPMSDQRISEGRDRARIAADRHLASTPDTTITGEGGSAKRHRWHRVRGWLHRLRPRRG